MIQATAAFAAELISGTSQPLGSSTTGDLWNLFHKNQSLYFTEFFQIYMETQPILYIIGILALLFLVLSAAYNCLYVIVRFGFDKCKVKRYQQHPTSTRLYAFLLMLFYLIWIVGMGTTLFFIYVTLIRKWTDTSHFDSDAVFESQGTDDDSFQVLDQIRDLSFSKNPVFSMEWVFNHVLKVIVPGNLILLLLAACATVVGTICYKNSRHPMDRSNTSNVMHNILAFCSGCSLLLLWVLVALGSTCFLYAHVHQNTCQEFQMRMQNDGIEKFVNSHNVSESQITEIAEMLADMEQERSEVNENICEAMARPYQTMWLSCSVIAGSSLFLIFVMDSLGKFYMQVDSIYYWNPEDPYSTLRMFQCNKDCFPPLPVLPMK